MTFWAGHRLLGQKLSGQTFWAKPGKREKGEKGKRALPKKSAICDVPKQSISTSCSSAYSAQKVVIQLPLLAIPLLVCPTINDENGSPNVGLITRWTAAHFPEHGSQSRTSAA